MADENKKQEMSEAEMAKEWEKMINNPPGIESESKEGSELTPDSSEEENAFGFDENVIDRNKTTTESPNIDFLLDIPLTISAELGRTKMIIYELLQLSQGSVIELNKLAGEPLDVRVNDKLIARGEAVVVNEKFGVRITDIVNPQERIENLKGQ